MRAIITWPCGGRTVFENCELGDPRIAHELDRLAKLGIQGVTLVFEDDFLP